VDSARGSQLGVFAQTMHQADTGAFTGEVSAPMLVEIDVQGVLLGHSERREHFGETDAALKAKVPRALEAGLVPVLCVGETEDERERGETEEKLRRQVTEDLADVAAERLADVVVAYEPIWAIGTGKTATPDQAQEAVAFVRSLVGGLRDGAGEEVRVLYGGSVNKDNLGELLGMPDVDGALVGGASLDPAAFAQMVETAARA
jgi:triosephosphate isomerase